MAGRVLLKTSLGAMSGYGNDGVGLARAFRDLGWDVAIVPRSVSPPLPQDIALMLTRAPEPVFDLTVVHADPSNLTLTQAEQRLTRFALSWSMWEWPQIPDDLPWKANVPSNMQYFDLHASYDEVSKAAFNEVLPESVPHIKLQGGYESRDWEYMERDWDADEMRFIQIGYLNLRKDPFASIKAFQLLKESKGDDFNATLIMKNAGRTLHPKLEELHSPWLKIIYDLWPVHVLKGFYQSAHCLLAPSRGEGKNLPAIEFASTGGAVIASAIGGHMEWISDQWAYPVQVSLKKDEANRTAAFTDPGHLAERIWEVYSDRQKAKQKGELAARTLPAMCDWEKVIGRLLDQVRQIPQRRMF